MPSIGCPVATSLAADAFALMKISSIAKGKTILWAWMSRGFLEPQIAANWHFAGNLEAFEEHMQGVKGAYKDLLSMQSLPPLDKSASTKRLHGF